MDGLEGASMQMPQYQCHKKVHALKILGVMPKDEMYLSVIVEAPFAPIEMPNEWAAKHSPVDGGYFVFYEDGYRSFSPAKAFEEGYTKI